MRVFKTKAFIRFADKASIPDSALCQAIGNAARGLIAASLGGSVIKQRIARLGRGKSSGFRTLIVFKAGTRAIFLHGFAKSEKDDVGTNELTALKKLAGELLAYDDKSMARVITAGVLVEITCDEKTIS